VTEPWLSRAMGASSMAPIGNPGAAQVIPDGLFYLAQNTCALTKFIKVMRPLT